MADDLLDTIIKVLQERNLPYDEDALKTALADPKHRPAIQDWVEEYLTPETLLTNDEAAFYAGLIKGGDADELLGKDLSMVQSLNEEEIRAAIEDLRRSTARIEKQSATLKLQQNAMKALVNSEKRTTQAREQTERIHVRQWDVEKNEIRAAITELSQSLKYQTTELELQAKESEQSFKQTVEGVLKSDDKLLLSLQKLASDLDLGPPENEAIMANIRELCAKLIKHTVEGVRTKLDRIYLTTLNTSSAIDEEKVNEQDAADLQEELESLYSEILPVAQMSTEQQHLEPALLAISATHGHRQRRTQKAIQYIRDCLAFLSKRLETLNERADESQCYRTALETVLATAKQELARAAQSPRAPSPVRPTITTQRSRKGSSTSNKSPRRTHRRSSGQGEEEIEPERQLARNLGIALPTPGEAESNIIPAMEKLLSERKKRLEGQAESLQTTMEGSIASHLGDAHVTLALLHETLLADTRYGKVRLVDPEMEREVEALEREISEVREGLEGIELHKLQGRNVHRDQFVARWSR